MPQDGKFLAYIHFDNTTSRPRPYHFRKLRDSEKEAKDFANEVIEGWANYKVVTKKDIFSLTDEQFVEEFTKFADNFERTYSKESLT